MKNPCFASTRPVQIATQCHNDFNTVARLCLHTPRADCNKLWLSGMVFLIGFASTRPVQIATTTDFSKVGTSKLCLHTPRADCNLTGQKCSHNLHSLPPHAPCRLQRRRHAWCGIAANFASTRPVQIATVAAFRSRRSNALCLHTPRADCNEGFLFVLDGFVLCLHTPRADCNQPATEPCASANTFASTRPVQIATA